MARNVIITQREKYNAATLRAGIVERRLDGGSVIGDAVAFCQVRRVLRVHIAKGEIEVGEANRGGGNGGGGDGSGGEFETGHGGTGEIEGRDGIRRQL